MVWGFFFKAIASKGDVFPSVWSLYPAGPYLSDKHALPCLFQTILQCLIKDECFGCLFVKTTQASPLTQISNSLN